MANAVFEAAPGVKLLNCYGPTETTVYSSWAHIDPEDRSEPTIGRPIWNTTLHVLDSGAPWCRPEPKASCSLVARAWRGAISAAPN